MSKWFTLNFFSNLPAETDVTIGITNDNETFESGSLTSTSLLLDWGNLEDLLAQLVLRVSWEEVVDDFGFLDGSCELEDLIQWSDLAVLHESSEFGSGLPITLVTYSQS